MALATQQTYVGLAQAVQSAWNQWLALKGSIDSLNNLVTDSGAQNVWKAMTTAAQNSNASLGATDTNPVITNPITVGSLGMSATDIINAQNDLVALSQVFSGSGGASIMNGSIDHRGDAPSVTNLTS